MKTLFTLLSFILNTLCFAQNIVPNYSFEQYNYCPTNLTSTTYEYSMSCTNWGQATEGTADYYNACDTGVAIAGVPKNRMGNQAAFDGTAYTGIYMYDAGSPNYKEYLINNIPALEIDTAYKVTIHVSLADYCEYATDAMGVLFTTYGSPSLYSDTTIIKIPQIDYTSYGVISDTTNWATLSSVFVADSTYTTLIIGGFKEFSEMTISKFNNDAIVPNGSYYYIDAIVVEKLSSATIINSPGNNYIETNLYPNPFTDHTTLVFNNSNCLNFTFSLFNAQGQIMQEIEGIKSNKLRIERNGLQSGFYYYQLRGENSIITNGKLIIK